MKRSVYKIQTLVGSLYFLISDWTVPPMTIAALMLLIICIVAVPTRYDVTPDRLRIRSGVLLWNVRVAEIVSIAPTANAFSSPAWSLERLEVSWLHAGDACSIVIAPERTEEFLRDVAARDKMLVVNNGCLRRAA